MLKNTTHCLIDTKWINKSSGQIFWQSLAAPSLFPSKTKHTVGLLKWPTRLQHRLTCLSVVSGMFGYSFFIHKNDKGNCKRSIWAFPTTNTESSNEPSWVLPPYWYSLPSRHCVDRWFSPGGAKVQQMVTSRGVISCKRRGVNQKGDTWTWRGRDISQKCQAVQRLILIILEFRQELKVSKCCSMLLML